MKIKTEKEFRAYQSEMEELTSKGTTLARSYTAYYVGHIHIQK